MKLNIVTKNPDKVLCAISEVYPDFHICHTEVCDNIHDFELVKEKENVVYPLDGLKELSQQLSYHGIPEYNIRIY